MQTVGVQGRMLIYLHGALMYTSYEDIMNRIEEPPTWFDDEGVPRYVPFSPKHLANIHAREAALAEIACQACGRLFQVALTGRFATDEFSLSDDIRLGRVAYGDPPNVGCCDAGATMNSRLHKVMEYWSRPSFGTWTRHVEFEGEIGEEINPPDTLGDIWNAVVGGGTRICVLCTSDIRQRVLAIRTAIATAQTRHVLLVVPNGYSGLVSSVIGRDMAPASGTKAMLGSIETKEIAQIANVEMSRYQGIICITAPPLPNEIDRRKWQEASAVLSGLPSSAVIVELTLARSCRLVGETDVLIES